MTLPWPSRSKDHVGYEAILTNAVVKPEWFWLLEQISKSPGSKDDNFPYFFDLQYIVADKMEGVQELPYRQIYMSSSVFGWTRLINQLQNTTGNDE